MLRLEKVNKYYRVGTHSLHVLQDVDFHVADGEFVSIMGASGSGKSTLLNILGILDDYDSGEYWLGDTLIRALSERRAADYRNRFIGFVFQSFNLLPFKTALENVALPLYYQGVTRRKRNQIAAQYLERVGLRDWAEHLPSEMSGGQKQRVAIARALISKPRLILADEPTGALDSETSKQIMDLMSEIHRTGITVLVVTHDSEVAARTQRTIRLRDGKVLGEHEASLSNPRMAAVTEAAAAKALDRPPDKAGDRAADRAEKAADRAANKTEKPDTKAEKPAEKSAGAARAEADPVGPGAEP